MWDQAEAYYHRALEVFIELDDRFRQGGTYHQLGAVAQEQQQWQRAEAYGLKSVALLAECQNDNGMLAALHALACLWLQTQSADLLLAVTQLIGGTPDEIAATFEKLLELGGTNANELHAMTSARGGNHAQLNVG